MGALEGNTAEIWERRKERLNKKGLKETGRLLLIHYSRKIQKGGKKKRKLSKKRVPGFHLRRRGLKKKRSEKCWEHGQRESN